MELQLYINQLYPLIFYYFYYTFFLKNIMNPPYQNIPKPNQMFFNQDAFRPIYHRTQFNTPNVQYNPYYTSFQSEIANKWNFIQYMSMQNQNQNAFHNQNGHQRIEIHNPNQINDYRNHTIPQQFYTNTNYSSRNSSNPLDFYNTNRNSQNNVQNKTDNSIILTKQVTPTLKSKNIHQFDPNTAPLLFSEKKNYIPKSIQNIIILDSDESVKENPIEKEKPIVSNVQKSTNITIATDTATSPTTTISEKVTQTTPKEIEQIQTEVKKIAKTNEKVKKIKKVVIVKKFLTKNLKSKPQAQKIFKIKKNIKKPKIDLQKQKEREKTKRQKKINLEEKDNYIKYIQIPNKICTGDAFQATIPQFIFNTKQYSQKIKQKRFDLSQRLAWNSVQKANVYKKLKQQYKQVSPKILIDLIKLQKQLPQLDKNRQTQIKSFIDNNRIYNQKQKMLIQLENRKQKLLSLSQTRVTRNYLKNKQIN